MMTDKEYREECRYEIEREEREEAYQKRIEALMTDHEVFASFVAEYKGYEVLTEALDSMVDGCGFLSRDMASDYREFCEEMLRSE